MPQVGPKNKTNQTQTIWKTVNWNTRTENKIIENKTKVYEMLRIIHKEKNQNKENKEMMEIKVDSLRNEDGKKA